MRMMSYEDAITFYTAEVARLQRAQERLAFADCPAIDNSETTYMIKQEIVQITRVIQGLHGHLTESR